MHHYLRKLANILREYINQLPFLPSEIFDITIQYSWKGLKPFNMFLRFICEYISNENKFYLNPILKNQNEKMDLDWANEACQKQLATLVIWIA